MFFAGSYKYEALYAQDKDGYSYVTVCKEGDHYLFIGKKIDDQREFQSEISGEITTDLILGGTEYINSSGFLSTKNPLQGEIRECRVYDGVLDISEIADIMESLRQGD